MVWFTGFPIVFCDLLREKFVCSLQTASDTERQDCVVT